VAPLTVVIGAVGVGDLLEVAQDPPQPGRVQPTGGLQQPRFGLHREVVGEVVGPWARTVA
jgi:hypothetical protein